MVKTRRSNGDNGEVEEVSLAPDAASVSDEKVMCPRECCLPSPSLEHGIFDKKKPFYVEHPASITFLL